MINNKFAELFNCPVKKEDSEIRQIHFDIGASAQLVLEEVLLKMVNHIYKKFKQKNLCMAGGVALNGVANYRIFREGPFDDIYIPPAPGDAGSAVGSALYVYYSHFNKQRVIEEEVEAISKKIYVGPYFSNNDIGKFLDTSKITYEKFERQELIKKTAKLISEKKVVGWFQGRMEWGPRALGNRCILADPRDEKMKDILNEKIKHRESFRPFAPSILEEYVSDYFELETISPYMLLVAKVKQPEKIPAVTHVDGTGRVHTVSRKTNSLFYDLIKEFFKITDIPVLINTSMNVRGEPIVNKPEEALVIFEENVEAFPGDAGVYTDLGEGYAENGDLKNAIGSYERALEIDSQNMNATEILRHIRYLE